MIDSDRLKLFHHAEAILRITLPEQLFSSPEECKNDYRALAFVWHPDKNKSKDATRVFAHINALYDQALDKIKKGLWVNLALPFKKQFKFELGEAFIGDDHVTYVVESRHSSYVDNFKKTLLKFKYGSDRMEKEVKRYLPIATTFSKQPDGSYVVTVPKTPDLIRLQDVLDFYKGSLDIKHVAWIESSLYNLCCYLNYAGLVHGDISLDNYFISPEHHSGALLGGWWYTTSVGSKLTSLPRRTFDLLPLDVKKDKRSSVSIDLELVRAVGRELSKTTLYGAPEPLLMWLRSVATDEPVTEYRDWKKTLEESFGARKFTKMALTSKEIY